ncbi:hypothetical protein QBC46DRAFT_399355 [Diplogelasinospora grovesii]|uniref:Uncharacterized protein n=1 Tax=Diplogelasinospora grovesii TaxID=303347 RepID=A0AAN6MW79_9PEZI|nr:hypothetical protein QBC46DRAFT_399355 [Diplogelasinospora grovesii]
MGVLSRSNEMAVRTTWTLHLQFVRPLARSSSQWLLFLASCSITPSAPSVSPSPSRTTPAFGWVGVFSPSCAAQQIERGCGGATVARLMVCARSRGRAPSQLCSRSGPYMNLKSPCHEESIPASHHSQLFLRSPKPYVDTRSATLFLVRALTLGIDTWSASVDWPTIPCPSSPLSAKQQHRLQIDAIRFKMRLHPTPEFRSQSNCLTKDD